MFPDVGTRRTTLALVLMVLAAASASAAAIGGLTTDALGAGQVAVATCDPDGFTVTHVLIATTVTDVIVGDIHADCGGGSLTVTLTGAGGAVVGSGGPEPVPGAGGSVTVAVSPTPDTADIVEHRLTIIGP